MRRAPATTPGTVNPGREFWLWLESRRFNYAFENIRGYARNPRPKCPETSRWRNCLVNLKTFGPRSFFCRQMTRYPRERILEALALLLWLPQTCFDAQLLGFVQSALNSSSQSFPELFRAYQSLWGRFN